MAWDMKRLNMNPLTEQEQVALLLSEISTYQLENLIASIKYAPLKVLSWDVLNAEFDRKKRISNQESIAYGRR